MKTTTLALALAASLLGCRGQISDKPPIHIIPDMDWQQKFLPQQEITKDLFADGRAMRPMVEDTVAQGNFNDNDAFTRGLVDDKHYVAVAPVEMNLARINRGQDRFNIYCAPCHDKAGSGHGMTVQRGFPLPVDLASDRVRGMSDGEVFNVITKGVRNMPSYAAQLPPEDRWNIVGWVRVIGRSQNAKLDDVPVEKRGDILAEGVTP
jgi:mono/diheme cytochrome c family protein